jgi:hypothetical protein
MAKARNNTRTEQPKIFACRCPTYGIFQPQKLAHKVSLKHLPFLTKMRKHPLLEHIMEKRKIEKKLVSFGDRK